MFTFDLVSIKNELNCAYDTDSADSMSNDTVECIRVTNSYDFFLFSCSSLRFYSFCLSSLLRNGFFYVFFVFYLCFTLSSCNDGMKKKPDTWLQQSVSIQTYKSINFCGFSSQLNWISKRMARENKHTASRRETRAVEIKEKLKKKKIARFW